MKNNLFAVINRGKFKGKKIYLPNKQTTRSTKSIVRGSFFDTLQNQIYNKTFIEVFGGSGIVSIEALSSGAKKAYIVESDKEAYKLTQKNISSLESNAIEVFNADTFELTPILVKNNQNIILYIDPPFYIRDGFEEIYDKVYNMINALPSQAISIIILEHISSYEPPNNYSKFIKVKTKKFGKTSLSYYY